MLIIGCDLHTRKQQVAMLESETGELVERGLEHANGEARAFYTSLPSPARVGIEATAPAQWFSMSAISEAAGSPCSAGLAR